MCIRRHKERRNPSPFHDLKLTPWLRHRSFSLRVFGYTWARCHYFIGSSTSQRRSCQSGVGSTADLIAVLHLVIHSPLRLIFLSYLKLLPIRSLTLVKISLFHFCTSCIFWGIVAQPQIAQKNKMPSNWLTRQWLLEPLYHISGCTSCNLQCNVKAI